tara:strand:- start:322 stop:570 length:249 start_codon:yes stop_codon:yes gene_type:complete
MQHNSAQRVLPLVNSKKYWAILEEYLQEEEQLIHQALVAATSEQEMYRLQGKAILLGSLLSLQENARASIKDGPEREYPKDT